MLLSTHQNIMKKIEEAKPGSILFPTDFRGYGSEAAIKMALSRLVKEGMIDRIAHGIYLLPEIHPKLGKLLPSLEEIAKAIAQKDRIRIIPAGAYALNKLGLSEQVPTKMVYITDGQARKINIGKYSIRFKPATPKKFGMCGQISKLLVQALEEISLQQITPSMKKKIKNLLKQEDPEKLNHDLKLAPARVYDFIISLNASKDAKY
jgi:hypothetical protein